MGHRSAHQLDDRLDLLDDDDARVGPDDVEDPAHGRPEAEAAHHDPSRRAAAQRGGEASESELGSERRARQEDDAAGEDLDEVARFAKDEVPWPVDGTDSDLSSIHAPIRSAIPASMRPARASGPGAASGIMRT